MSGKHQKIIHNNLLVLYEQLESIPKIIDRRLKDQDKYVIYQLSHDHTRTLKTKMNNTTKLIIEHTNTLPWLSLKDQDQINIIPQSQNSQASCRCPKTGQHSSQPKPKA